MKKRKNKKKTEETSLKLNRLKKILLKANQKAGKGKNVINQWSF